MKGLKAQPLGYRKPASGANQVEFQNGKLAFFQSLRLPEQALPDSSHQLSEEYN